MRQMRVGKPSLLSPTPLSPSLVISLFLISPILSRRIGHPFILTAATLNRIGNEGEGIRVYSMRSTQRHDPTTSQTGVARIEAARLECRPGRRGER